MAQILFKDKIGTLSEAAGVISLASGSILTIGGQQYTTSAILQVTPSSLTVNSWYRIYAVESGGAVSLVVDTNNNSTGPSGQSAWKLVGHFYSDSVGAVVGVVAATEDGYAKPEPAKIRYAATNAVNLVAGAAVQDFHIKSHDNYNAVTGTGVSWVFTAVRDGEHKIEAQLALALTSSIFFEFRIDINKNGGLVILSKVMKDVATSTTPPTVDIQDTIYLNKGDTLSISGSCNVTLARNTAGWANHVTIEELPSRHLIKDEEL